MPVVFSIPSSPFPIEGDYSVLWSSTGTFDEGRYTTLTTGNLPRGGHSVSVTFKVPEVTAGTYYVEFFQIKSDPVILPFTIKPGITAIPVSARPGSTIVINGNGFPGGDSGVVYLEGQLTSVPIATSSNGTFTASLTVPNISTGARRIVATTGHAGTQIAAPFEVVSGYDTPFPYNQTETLNFNGYGTNTNTANSAIANLNNVPAKTTTAGKTRPPKPVTISPKGENLGWSGKQSVNFTWETVADANGITYTLEVGNNVNFSPLLSGMPKTTIKGTSYTMDISSGTYYWRVKAVDSQGNEGDWSYSPYSFKVGGFPFWPMMIGEIALICILVVLIRAFKRSTQSFDPRNNNYSQQ